MCIQGEVYSIAKSSKCVILEILAAPVMTTPGAEHWAHAKGELEVKLLRMQVACDNPMGL
jgi:hypothetical protein